MKGIALTSLMLMFLLLPTMAQTEVQRDSLPALRQSDARQDVRGSLQPSNDGIRNYGGFLLDMNSIMPAQAEAIPSLTAPATRLHVYQDLNELLRLRSNATYATEMTGILNSRPMYYGLYHGYTPMGFYGGWGGMNSVHTANFRLRNGMTLSTFGDYDSEGRRHVSPTALPWQRNNFQGGFRLKSANGKFSFQVRVNRGRGPY